MKIIFLALFAILPVQTFASTINLSSGEQVEISANTRTTVTCNGQASVDCTTLIASFNRTMVACYKEFGGGVCAQKYWGKFAAANPTCAPKAADICFYYCEKEFGGGTCAEICQ